MVADGLSGKISNISVTPEGNGADSSKSATVTFEKETYVAHHSPMVEK